MNTEIFIIVLLLVQIVAVASILIYFIWKFKVITTKESEYYTDYVRGTTIMRVYKPEFEFQAIGNLPPSKILDVGTLSVYYKWALIDTRK